MESKIVCQTGASRTWGKPSSKNSVAPTTRRWKSSKDFPTAKITTFVTQRLNPNLNRAQRGEGVKNRLRGAMNERGEGEAGYRNTSGGGRITYQP